MAVSRPKDLTGEATTPYAFRRRTLSTTVGFFHHHDDGRRVVAPGPCGFLLPAFRVHGEKYQVGLLGQAVARRPEGLDLAADASQLGNEFLAVGVVRVEHHHLERPEVTQQPRRAGR
jgi:hypothetical protein